MDERADRFGRLFEGCYQSLHAYARRRASAADADDVVAEVLAIAWRRLDDIPLDAQLPWLYGVARRTLANQRRGSERRTRLVERLTREPVADAPVHGDAPVLAALARLRPDDREILRLAAWEGLATAEIAVALRCSANAAALRLSRARRRLRAELTGTSGARTPEEWKVTDA